MHVYWDNLQYLNQATATKFKCLMSTLHQQPGLQQYCSPPRSNSDAKTNEYDDNDVDNHDQKKESDEEEEAKDDNEEEGQMNDADQDYDNEIVEP